MQIAYSETSPLGISIKGKPLFKGEEHFFWVSKLGFNLHSLKGKRLYHSKSDWPLVDKFECTLSHSGNNFQTINYLHELKLMYWLLEFNTQHRRDRDKLIMIIMYQRKYALKEKTFKNITENFNVLVCIWAFKFSLNYH